MKFPCNTVDVFGTIENIKYNSITLLTERKQERHSIKLQKAKLKYTFKSVQLP